MKLIKYNQAKISDEKSVPGLVSSRIEYEVKTAKGNLEYHGPKLAPELWHQVLSFFRWTHKEHQSECQVRLYVNVKLARWAARELDSSTAAATTLYTSCQPCGMSTGAIER